MRTAQVAQSRRTALMSTRTQHLRYLLTGADDGLLGANGGGTVALAQPIGLDAKVHQGYYAEGLVASIAAAAGLDVQWPRLGHAIDFSVFRPGLNGTSASKQINLQVKSWSKGRLSADAHFHYRLEVKAFNHLAGNGHDVRHYLVLCLVPSQASAYAHARPTELQLKHAAYWLSLRDEQPVKKRDPHSTKTVLVPATNLLTTETIRALVEGNEQAAVVP